MANDPYEDLVTFWVQAKYMKSQNFLNILLYFWLNNTWTMYYEESVDFLSWKLWLLKNLSEKHSNFSTLKFWYKYKFLLYIFARP
jgi:hypothetical protein